ncbi:unnamed protein product [Rotaria sp. Silwood1]|nr:unnamed protein product [Rotaria sp. Silwood1]CAF3648286.1 unnamed protein product [Rotaria sp. Silwood1]CAF3680051.1 unnamed protein product [Rotaria sp. Silwood1]CAF3682995.1 unnamed protein product [Rotaria sp. Silwood1]CAF3787699.1 unnamed protein product [Rotaria sp. Silwood1]
MAKFESPTIVERKLKVEFGKNAPKKDCIIATFQRFCETGSVEDRERSGRPSTITEDMVEEVRDAIDDEPQSSVRTIATDCSIPKTTTHRIMTEYLLLKPYKAQFVQQLFEEDLQDRVEMCKILIPMLQDNAIQGNIFFSDEAVFYLHGLVNKHNIRYWSESNPNVTIETVMKSPKINVWCAMSKYRLIGPFYFQEDTVHGKDYLSMLQDFFLPEIKRLRKVRSVIFQQDGAPAHFSADVRHYLNDQFPDRWIGRGGSIRWAPRSPDLTPLDFYLWGHLKNNVYQSPIKDLDELKTRIHNEIKSISKTTLSNVFSNIIKRMELCISVDGDHFEHLL